MLSRAPLVSIVLLALVLAPALAPTRARQATADSVVVTLEPAAGQSVNGLVILTEAGDGQVDVQVQIVGAEPGTVTMIHRGACDDYDPTPVALLGDAGTAGTIQTTIKVPLATLTDGDHVVALHDGVTNRSSALACGEIALLETSPEPPEPPDEPTSTMEPFDPPEPPDTDDPTATGEPFEPPDPDAPTSTPDDPDPVVDRTYTSPTYGYSFSWGDEWEVREVGTRNGDDLITLWQLWNHFAFAGTSAYNGDLSACLDELGARMRGDPGDVDVSPMRDAAGRTIAGQTANTTWAAYRLVYPEQHGSDPPFVEYHECIRIDETATLAIVQLTDVVKYDEAAVEREAVLATLSIPGQPPRPTPEPAREPATPTIAPTPEPCAGFDDWSDVTWPRIERLYALILEVRAATLDTIKRVLTAARDEIALMADEQQQVDPPAIAVDLHNRFVTLLVNEVDLANRSLDFYENDPGNRVTLDRIGREANEYIEELERINSELTRMESDCG